MENTNLPESHEQIPTPQIPKKIYGNKGFLAILLLAIIAATAVWVYFILNQPRDLGPVVVSHKLVSNSSETSTTSPATLTGSQSSANSSGSTSISPFSTSSPSQIAEETKHWLEYRNSEYGLYFKYPIGWYTQEISNPESWGVNVAADGDTAWIQFTAFGSGGLSSLQQLFPGETPEVSNTTLNSASAILYKFAGESGIQIISQLPKWGKSDNIIDFYSNGELGAEANNQQIINTILSTVVFFPPAIDNDTSNWNTYSTYGSINGVGYSFNYPLEWTSSSFGFPILTERSGATISINTPANDPAGYGPGTATSILVDGENATETIGSNQAGSGFAVVSFNDPGLNKVFDLSMSFDPANTTYYTDLLGKILSTFTFNRVNLDTTTWQPLDNYAMGIELQYPSNWSVIQQTASSTIITDSVQQNSTSPGPNDSFVKVEPSSQCQATNSFQVADLGPNTLVRIFCESGLKFTLAVWAQNIDKANIMSAMETIPTTLNLVQQGGSDVNAD